MRVIRTGGGGSFEVPYSKRVADALGYEWHCVEYTDQKILELLSDKTTPYYEYTKQHDYFSYTQNFIAVRELHEEGLIPENAVMITGLCNDMPTGCYILSKNIADGYSLTVDGAARCIVDSRFPRDFMHRRMNKNPIKEQEHEIFVEEVKEYIMSLGLEVNDYQSFVVAVDCFTTGYLHSRCFLHMNDVHEFFGNEWLLPCWNRELLKFWYSLPVEMRYKQNLYEEYVTHTLGEQYGLTMKKVGSLSDKQITVAGKVVRKLKIFLQGLLYPLGITIINDHNNDAPTRMKLYKLVRQKKALNDNLTEVSRFMSIYLMEQKYGTKWFKRIRKALS